MIQGLPGSIVARSFTRRSPTAERCYPISSGARRARLKTIVQGYFNMMMIVDTSRSSKPYADMVTELDELGDGIGVKIRCQREDIFTKMHRI